MTLCILYKCLYVYRRLYNHTYLYVSRIIHPSLFYFSFYTDCNRSLQLYFATSECISLSAPLCLSLSIGLSLSLSLSAASGYTAAVPQGHAEEGRYIAGPALGLSVCLFVVPLRGGAVWPEASSRDPMAVAGEQHLFNSSCPV